MKESISYTFLLNIVIVFIFTCFAIIMGVLSYYKAFKANSIILNEIEKYEGYNCLAKDSINTKLQTIGYQTPFTVSCNSSDGKCEASERGYKVVSYNLDFEGKLVYPDEQMNSVYICDTNGCATNKHYRYGVYTYMYVDLPVISHLLKVTIFSKSSIMYDFRNYYVGTESVTDAEESFEFLYEKDLINDKSKNINNRLYVRELIKKDIREEDVDPNHVIGDMLLSAYAARSTNHSPYKAIQEVLKRYDYVGSNEYDYRNDAKVERLLQDRYVNAVTAGQMMEDGLNYGIYRRKCGYIFDYSKINIGG